MTKILNTIPKAQDTSRVPSLPASWESPLKRGQIMKIGLISAIVPKAEYNYRSKPEQKENGFEDVLNHIKRELAHLQEQDSDQSVIISIFSNQEGR